MKPHEHWTLVPCPLQSPPATLAVVARSMWTPPIANKWVRSGAEYTRGDGVPAHAEFEIVEVKNCKRLVLPAVSSLFELHSIHMQASAELCEHVQGDINMTCCSWHLVRSFQTGMRAKVSWLKQSKSPRTRGSVKTDASRI